jgi:hypothetical protein
LLFPDRHYMQLKICAVIELMGRRMEVKISRDYF